MSDSPFTYIRTSSENHFIADIFKIQKGRGDARGIKYLDPC